MQNISLDDDYSYQPNVGSNHFSDHGQNDSFSHDINNVSYPSQVDPIEDAVRFGIDDILDKNEHEEHSSLSSVIPGSHLNDLELQNELDTDLSDEDTEFLFALRERLLKMASFGGFNKICLSYLRNLQRTHQTLRSNSMLSSTLSDADHQEAQGYGRVCKEGIWLVLLFLAIVFTFVLLFWFGSLSTYSYSNIAQRTTPTVGLTFFLSNVALFSLLFFPKISLMLSCPLATLVLFVFGMVVYVVRKDEIALLFILSAALIIGLWGARSVPHIKNTLPLFKMSISIIRHHFVLLPIAIITSFIISVWTFHILTVVFAIVYSYQHVSWTILSLILVLWIWIWFVQVCRYVFQSVIYGVVSYHYHLTTINTTDHILTNSIDNYNHNDHGRTEYENTNTSTSNSNSVNVNTTPPNLNTADNIPTTLYYNNNPNTPLHIPPPPQLSIALLLRILTHSLGSIAHGAVFAAQARILWLFVRKIVKIMKARHVHANNRNRGFLTHFLRKLLMFSEWLHCRFNKFSFRYIMLFGYGFKFASRFTYKRFMDKGTDTLTSDLTAEGFVTLYAVTAGSIGGIVITTSFSYEYTWFIIFNAIAIAVAVGVIFDVLTTSIICVFSCYGEWSGGLAKYDTTVALSLARAVEFAQFEDRREMEEAEIEARG